MDTDYNSNEKDRSELIEVLGREQYKIGILNIYLKETNYETNIRQI